MKVAFKICGLTREQDVDAAVEAGVDAIGFVFYSKSPRAVTAQHAAELASRIPPFVTVTGLFVNATEDDIADVLRQVPLNLLQFHGDERPTDCERWARPYIRAARVRPGLDLVQYAAEFSSARGILLDAYVEGYGGGGQTFDWSVIPASLPRPVILSGGLDASNVSEAIRRVRPVAVDVSSGVEAAKGIKDAAKIAAFAAAVRAANQ